MKLLNGKLIADKKLELLKARVADLDRPPSLAVVLVGDDYGSHLYIKLKEKAAKKVGMDFHKYLLNGDASQEQILETVSFLRDDEDIDGILIQLPLPQGIDTSAVIAAMGSQKDADGFHPENIAMFESDASEGGVYPVFPAALISLAEASDKKLDGAKTCVIAKRGIFTQTMATACKKEGMEVSVMTCDALDKKELLQSEIIFTACDKSDMITSDMVGAGTVIVDGGIVAVDGKTVGNVDTKSFEEAFVKEGKKVSISPVPGGVGPMTIACLLENVVDLAVKK